MSDFVKQPAGYAWYLPSNKRGDAARLGAGAAEIPPTIDYLIHIAKTAGAMNEYIEAGAAAFILSGWPHGKEAGNFGRMFRPLPPDEVLVKAGV